MDEQAQLEQTIALMKSAHDGQYDKNGKPYWQHPMAVMELLGPDASLDAKLTALLHDIVEDTELSITTISYLGYSPEVVGAVYLLTRPKGMNYIDYITRLAESGNKIAIRVKVADLMHNLDPNRPIPDNLRERYEKALAFLQS